MYIGHFGPAAVLLSINKTVAPLPVMVGAAFPDLLWGVLVLAGKEKVRVFPKTSLQSKVKFTKFPYSHSLIYTNLLALIPAALFGLLYWNWVAGLFFWLGSVSHWLLDAVVHFSDLPIKGFGKDRKVGLGLWRQSFAAFLFEYLFFAACAAFSVSNNDLLAVLIIGAALHLINANSFFGLTPKNPTPTPKLFALSALVGFIIAIAAFTGVLS